MKTTDGVELLVMFADRGRFYEFLRDVDRGAVLDKTLLRSRLTTRGGWMKLALRGPSERIEEIVRAWGDAIASFTRLEKAS